MNKTQTKLKVSVCIPTYNRYDILKLNLELFLKVKNKKFEIIIVDDGSTDKTKKLIEEISKKAKFKIKYFYHDNQGLFKSLSKAILNSAGEYVVYQGSDDLVVVDEFDNFLNGKFENKITSSEVAGVSFRCIDENNKVVGELHNREFYSHYSIEHYSNNNRGDKKFFLKTYIFKKVIKKYLDFDDNIPPAALLLEIDKNYKFYFCNTAMAKKSYLKEGITKNYFLHIRKNPNGFLVLASKILKIPTNNKNVLILKFKQSINFTRYFIFCLILKKRISHLDKLSYYYLIILLFSPLGIILSIYDKYKLFKIKKN